MSQQKSNLPGRQMDSNVKNPGQKDIPEKAERDSTEAQPTRSPQPAKENTEDMSSKKNA